MWCCLNHSKGVDKRFPVLALFYLISENVNENRKLNFYPGELNVTKVTGELKTLLFMY